jgi:hypothetical protein
MYISLVEQKKANSAYTYDLVTATDWDLVDAKSCSVHPHDAVAITDGLSAQQNDDAEVKLQHEAAFPLDLLDKGVKFQCADGKASKEEDTMNILEAIKGKEALDDVVHGVVATAALRRVLEGFGERAERYLDALRRGNVRQLHLDLKNSPADTPETWKAIGEALSPETHKLTHCKRR